MARYAFKLRVRPDRIEEYDAAHKSVWPELLAVIRGAGIRNYSIFRRGSELFFFMEADDFDASWARIERSDVNSRWQAMMAPLFDHSDRPGDGERFPMMNEVFRLD